MAATEDTKLVLQISADIKSLERALKKSGQLVKETTTEIEKGFGKTGPAVEDQAKKIDRSMRQMQAGAQNLSFQLNDITQGLLSGTSPFTIMMQQSSQASQAIQSMGKGNVLKGVTSAFSSMLSPASLAISALILGFGAVAQAAKDYFDGSEKEAKDLNEELNKQVAILNTIRKQQGLPEIDTDTKSPLEKFIAMRDALKKTKDAAEPLADTLNEIQNLISSKRKDEFGGQTYTVQVLSSELSKLKIGIKDGTADFEAFARKMAELEGINLPEEIRELVTQLIDLALKAALSKEALDKVKAAMVGIKTEVPELNAAMIAFNPLEPLTSDMIKLNEFSAGVAEYKRLAGEAKGITADLIKDREGFITHAKKDNDGRFRVGFGSDTYVDELGHIKQVTKDTIVTMEQANADLARRIGEFQRGVIGAIGPEMWASMDEKQQAALTSIAYNYGSLPDRVAKAIKTGDRGQVAQAIADLGGDNGGINRGRRKMEAELYGGGSYDAKKKSIQDLMLTQQQSIELQEKQNAINADSSLKEEEKLYRIDKLTASTKLLNEAQQEGIELTDAVRAKIEQQAIAYANAEQQQRQLSNAQKDGVKSAKELKDEQERLNQAIGNIAKSAISGFINDLRNGVSAGEAFSNMLDRVIDGIINMTLEAMFSKNALGGIFGKIFSVGGLGVGTAHRGTGGGTTDMRTVSPAIFAGAPRLHNGLNPGEFPAILQQGEKVISRSAVRRGAGSGGNTYLGDVQVDVSTGMVTANNNDARDLGHKIDAAVQAVLVRESRPGGLLKQRGAA